MLIINFSIVYYSYEYRDSIFIHKGGINMTMVFVLISIIIGIISIIIVIKDCKDCSRECQEYYEAIKLYIILTFLQDDESE